MKQFLLSVCGGAALLALLAGCDPSMAQIQSGSQEEQWYKQLKENYTSFRPPQYPAPAVYGRSARPAAVVPAEPVGAPADDPEKVVDRAAAGEETVAVKQEAVTKAAPAEEVKAPAAADAKKAEADAKKADAKAVKAEKTDDKTAKEPAAAPETEKFHVVKSGETLGAIAKQYYGRASMEDVIFKANDKVIKNRNRLSVGMRLVIPEL